MPWNQANQSSSGGGGGGTVNSVSAANASIVIGGTAADPTVAVGTPRLENRILIEDDWISQTLASRGGWIATNSGTGATIGPSALNTDAEHQGIIRLETGTTATGRTALNQAGASMFQLGTGEAEFCAVVAVPTLSDGTDTFTDRIGLGDVFTAGEHVDAIGFRYSNGINAGEWEAYCRANNVETTLDTNVAVVANRWDKLEARVNSAGTSVDFLVNGAAVGTISSNVPNGSARALGIAIKIEKSAGTTNRDLLIDFLRYSKVTAR